MRLDGAWNPRTPLGASESEEVADVRQQAEEWAAAEPNIIGIIIGRIHRPYPERRHWYEVEIEAQMRERAVQPTLGLEVAS